MTDTIPQFERTLLATMMLRPADCWRADVQPHHFLVETHGEVLAKIRSLSAESKPVDPVSVADAFDCEGRKVLANLTVAIASDAPLTAVPDAYSQRIVAAWRQREAQAIGRELLQSKDPGAVDSAIAGLMALHATETQHEFSAKDAARIACARLNEVHAAGGKLPGITTGLADLDDKLGGFHAGDLIVIGGRAAMGKTAMLLGCSRAAARTGVPVGLISGEQPVDQVAIRIASAESRMSAKRFRTADFEEHEWPRVFDGFTNMSGLPLHILDRSAPTMAEVVRVARRWVHQYGIKALYVDYLQRIVGEGDRKYEQVGYVARSLKNLARDLNIPVITLAQVSRDVEKTAGNPRAPRMADLSDSSEIEKEADQILMLFREGHYDAKADQGTARIIVEKNRHGPTGFVEAAWLGDTMTFADLAHVGSYGATA